MLVFMILCFVNWCYEIITIDVVLNHDVYICFRVWCLGLVTSLGNLFFFFKQKPAYELRISDCSSTCALPICWNESPAVPAGEQRGGRRDGCSRRHRHAAGRSRRRLGDEPAGAERAFGQDPAEDDSGSLSARPPGRRALRQGGRGERQRVV